ncbi:OmpW family outer membrane protein [Neolewinella agarilytica]|uniref:OmpW family outer membrane protein n=1 Tax=Neolewinella agarilytica TaxID=478744 RepID=UPI00235328C5|nr:OmpW family outer membrane protein [Neolewinella agarilytica]
MPKSLIILTLLFFCPFRLPAQESNPTTLAIETGLVGLFDAERLGLFLHLEPKHRFSKNGVIGLRIGITLNTQTIENYDSFQFIVNRNEEDQRSDNGVISVVPTYDHYLKQVNNFRPYVGAGVGYYISGSYVEASRIVPVDPSEGIFEIGVNNQVGLLLRGGVESDKLRLGIEYNFMPKTDLKLPDSTIVGTVDKSYLGLSVGVKIGKKRTN